MGFVIAGLATGVIGGLLGVGAGEIFSPTLIYVFGFLQHKAQGTSLAILLPPIGLQAAPRYYRFGYVDFAVAGVMAAGFFIGAYGGSTIATRLPADALRKPFGAFLLIVPVHMIFGHHGR